MRILATGSAKRGALVPSLKSAGFTLVEILVVMVIIALASSIVVLSLPSGEKPLADTGDQFAARLSLMAESASIGSSMTGIEISGSGYRLAARRLGQWQDHPTLGEKGRIYPWPEGTSLTLLVEGEEISLPYGFDTDTKRAPDLYFLPSGEAVPFSLILTDADERVELTADRSGSISKSTERF